jgi:3-hydroxyisobutyrate dehydrogenase
VDGTLLRYSDAVAAGLKSNPASPPAFAGLAGSLVAVAGFNAAGIIAGTPYGSEASGVRNAAAAEFNHPDAFILSDGAGANRYPIRAGTDAGDVAELGSRVIAKGGEAAECPVSGGCHRAATGNISIFAAGPREGFERVLPVLTTLGRRVLHTGDWGTASQLKVMTNFLCTAHLVALAEALTVCKAMGLDMNTTYEAIRISSGNSFVHETESQVILNGSRDINFTMDLVSKDVGLFDKIAQETGVPVEMSPLIVRLFKEAEAEYGSREFSPNIIRRYEEPLGLKVLGTGFPDQMVDDEPEERGYEVVPKR